MITSRHLRDSWFGWIDHQTTSYSANGSFSLTLNGSVQSLGGGYLPNYQGYSFNDSAFAGHTAYAQKSLTYGIALGHYYYDLYTINNASTNFNFLNRSCSVNY